jgi:hypothetical protein
MCNWDALKMYIKEEKDKQDLIKTKQNTKPVTERKQVSILKIKAEVLC